MGGRRGRRRGVACRLVPCWGQRLLHAPWQPIEAWPARLPPLAPPTLSPPLTACCLKGLCIRLDRNCGSAGHSTWQLLSGPRAHFCVHL